MGVVELKKSVESELSQKVFPAYTPLSKGGIQLVGECLIDYQAAESFRIIRARIERLNISGKRRQVICVTSAVAEEGKSLVACNLSRSLSSDPRGKTIIIDCDLRKPTVSKYLNLERTPGLSDAVVGNNSLYEVIQSAESGLDVITAGTAVNDAIKLIELPRFREFIDALKKTYNYIILDCPPILLCPEPLILSSIVDSSLMVIKAWETERKIVEEAVNLLGREKLCGIIINGANDTIAEYGYYGYEYQENYRKDVGLFTRLYRNFKRNISLRNLFSAKYFLIFILASAACGIRQPSLAEQKELLGRGFFFNGTPSWVATRGN